MEKNNKHRYSRTASALLIVAIMLAALLAVGIAAQIWAGRQIGKLLEQGPVEFAGGTYITSVGRVGVDLSRLSLSLSDVEIRTRGQRAKSGPAPYMEGSIDRVTVSGITVGKKNDAGFRKVRIRDVYVTSPAMVFHGIPAAGADRTAPAIQAKIRSRRLDMKIDQLRIAGASATVGIWRDRRKTSLTLHGADLVVTDMTTGEWSAPPENMPPHNGGTTFARAILAVDSMTCTYGNGASRMTVTALSYDSNGGRLAMGGASLSPQYSKQQFSRKVGDGSDWMAVSVTGVTGEGIILPRSPDDTLQARSLKAEHVLFEVFCDRNQPRTQNVRPTIYEMVWNFPLGAAVDTIAVNDLDVVYEEISAGARTPAVITLDNTRLSLHGLTNRPSAPDQLYRMNIDGWMMGKGLLHAVLELPAAPGDDRFVMQASVEPMPATAASPVTEPLSNVRISSGVLDSVNIVIEGDSRHASCALDLRYHDLSIALVRKNAPDSERRFLSTIANGMIIKSDNPSDGVFRTGSGEYEREPNKSFWNFIWKTAFAGVLNVVI